MKARLTNNLGLKVLAIFLAFLVWLLVSNVSNPIITGTKEIPVEILNEHILRENGLTYEVLGKNTVTVNFGVNTLNEYKISSNDFHAYADLADLYDVTGAIPVKVDVINNKDLIMGTPTTKQGVIRVKTEEIQRKKFDLKSKTVGDTEDGYAIGEVTLAPDYVYVTGAVSVIGKINSVGVEIEVEEGTNASFSGTVKPIFYDSNQNKFDLADEITLSTPEITYQVEVLKVKNLGLDFQVEGAVASGYRFTGVESDIKSVQVEGMKSILASLTTLTVPGDQLKLNGANRDVVVKVDLVQLLPENVTLAGEQETIATVTLKVEPLETRGFKIATNEIELIGDSDEYEYTFSTKTLQVNIQGLSDDLDALKDNDMKPSVNVSSMKEGVHLGTVALELGEGFKLIDHEMFEIKVELIENPDEDEDDMTEPEESSSAEESSNVNES